MLQPWTFWWSMKPPLSRRWRIGAHMVIYGVLDAQGGFVPQFYVVPEARGQIAGMSPGNFQLGADPIRFSGSSTFKANVSLQSRASALFYLIMGMTYDFLGLTDQSLEIYREAGDQLKSWAEKGQGKEVLYFLWGQRPSSSNKFSAIPIRVPRPNGAPSTQARRVLSKR
jgi:hypothetical protein